MEIAEQMPKYIDVNNQANEHYEKFIFRFDNQGKDTTDTQAENQNEQQTFDAEDEVESLTVLNGYSSQWSYRFLPFPNENLPINKKAWSSGNWADSMVKNQHKYRRYQTNNDK